MSVLVKGMKMPMTCTMCDLAHALKTSDGTARLACAVVGKWQDNYTFRPMWCPLKEVEEQDVNNLEFQNWELQEAAQMKLGDRLSAVLKRKHMTQKELSKRINVTEASICRYINNQRVPKATTVMKMAKVLDVDVDELLGLEREGVEQ